MSPAAPIRVLLADDEPIFLAATAELLRLEGYAVATAASGPEGEGLLAAGAFDILISDVQMPGNRDLAFVQAAVKRNPGLRVILVTGYPSLDTAVQAIHLTVAAYLTKPVTADDLLVQLGQVAAGLRVQRAAGASRDRLLQWVQELDQTLPAGAAGVPDRDAARTVLGLALGNIAGVLLDLKAIFDLSLEHGPGRETCTVRTCPRLAETHAAVADAIRVIEGTKGSFKSKELGDLRERLRGVLADRPHN